MNQVLMQVAKRLRSETDHRLAAEYIKEFENSILCINIQRIQILSVILIFLNGTLLYADLKLLKPYWTSIPGYKTLYHAHIFAMLLMLFFLLLSLKRRREKGLVLFDRVLCYASVTGMLLWCVALAVNAQLIHGQISAYIIGLFCISSVLLMNSLESVVMFSASYLLFILGTLTIDNGFAYLTGEVVNATFTLVLALAVSRINYAAYRNYFIGKRVLSDRNMELDASLKVLQEKYRECTEELIITNKMLKKEIHCRFEAELKALSAEERYREEMRRSG